jgi:1-acyl-sn-glycerol-3-phosphate acyltransferase
VLASNHASHLDALVLAAALPPRLRAWLVPLAAADVFFRTPVRARLVAGLLGALPMPRGRCGAHRLRAFRERLLGGPCVYVLFPEGTRTRTGVMAPFRGGLGALVAGTDVPVLPCHLRGTFAALPPGRRVPRPRAVVLRIGPPLSFAGVENNRDGWRRVSACVAGAVRRLAEAEPYPDEQWHGPGPLPAAPRGSFR